MEMKAILAALALSALGLPCAAMAQTEPSALNEQQKVVVETQGSVLANICHLQIKRKILGIFPRSYTGSAVLYNERYLLTAGHNGYQSKSKISSIAVRCGVLDARTTAPDFVVNGDDVLAAQGYSGKPFSLDFAVIRLPGKISVTRPMTLSMDGPQTGEAIVFAGYPGGPHNGQEMYQATGKIETIAGGITSYDITTFKSNSGGPIWRERNGRAELLGIHVMPSAGRAVDADYRAEVQRLIMKLDARAGASN
jgi:V8-like Glu-specific endopeptidase